MHKNALRKYSGVLGESNGRVNGKLEELESCSSNLSKVVDKLETLIMITSLQPPEVKDGLNFYEEVRRVEIALIKQALRLAGGSQSRAATLLNLRLSTLNSKIKSFEINWRECV